MSSESDLYRRFDVLMAEAGEALDRAFVVAKEGAVSPDDLRAVVYLAGRISGYVDAWIQLEPRRAHRATMAAERFVRVLQEAEARLRRP
ncbi:MAG: hypothetical protein ACYDGR_05235 [Candidatus Dormibacteria bacterium]